MATTFSRLNYHFVFSTKDRCPSLGDGWRERLHGYVGGVLREIGGTMLEAGSVADHLHLLARLPPTISPAVCMHRVKGGSSRWINAERLAAEPFSWQDGYAAFSVAPRDFDAVRRYVRNQAEHHRGRSFQDEFRSMLDLAGIECDERMMWA